MGLAPRSLSPIEIQEPCNGVTAPPVTTQFAESVPPFHGSSIRMGDDRVCGASPAATRCRRFTAPRLDPSRIGGCADKHIKEWGKDRLRESNNWARRIVLSATPADEQSLGLWRIGFARKHFLAARARRAANLCRWREPAHCPIAFKPGGRHIRGIFSRDRKSVV